MPHSHDEKALKVLEEAVYRAQNALESTHCFQPFLMLLNDTGEIEIFENKIQDSTQSYTALEETLKVRMQNNDIDVLVFAVDTVIPDRFAKDISTGIRLHLEEKSQMNHKIGARYLYVPYELCRSSEGTVFTRLHPPIPIGLPAEYLVSRQQDA